MTSVAAKRPIEPTSAWAAVTRIKRSNTTGHRTAFNGVYRSESDGLARLEKWDNVGNGHW